MSLESPPSKLFPEYVKFPQLRVIVCALEDGTFEAETIDGGGVGCGRDVEEALAACFETLDSLYEVALDSGRPMQSEPRADDLAAYNSFESIGPHRLRDGRFLVAAFRLNRTVGRPAAPSAVVSKADASS